MAINDSMIDAEIWIENHCIVRKQPQKTRWSL